MVSKEVSDEFTSKSWMNFEMFDDVDFWEFCFRAWRNYGRLMLTALITIIPLWIVVFLIAFIGGLFSR
jgi:hypothetical protein